MQTKLQKIYKNSKFLPTFNILVKYLGTYNTPKTLTNKMNILFYNFVIGIGVDMLLIT